jgi:hypothetical protein
MMVRARLLLLLLLMLVSLGACTTGSSAIEDTIRFIRSPNKDVASATLRTDIRYLRLTTDGRVLLLALGYLEPGSEGDTEVWYSGTGEVLRLRRGRIIGATGLATDWRAVRLPPLPRWTDVATTPITFKRERDQMPGYRYNITDTIALRAIAAPTRSALLGIDAASLRWFEERIIAGPKEDIGLPPARYGVAVHGKQETVVYAEQCLVPDLCLTWQHWPPKALGDAQTGSK